MSLMYWPGLLLFGLGGWLVYAAISHRNRIIAWRDRLSGRGLSADPPKLDPSFEAMGAVMPPIINFCLLMSSATLCGLFFFVEADRYFSAFDLAGVVFALAGCAVKIYMDANYRAPALPRDHEPKAEPAPGTVAPANLAPSSESA